MIKMIKRGRIFQELRQQNVTRTISGTWQIQFWSFFDKKMNGKLLDKYWSKHDFHRHRLVFGTNASTTNKYDVLEGKTEKPITKVYKSVYNSFPSSTQIFD